ncbi:MAG: VCBS repeat-containing protein [Bacteroidetes bacterium]|nr:VCBS repeat-containing protein [Bacteroidota bacterium]
MKKQLLLLLMLFIVFGYNLVAQSPCCNYYDSGQNPGPGVDSETFGIGLGDIDGDGDLDAVVIDAYDDMEIYTNDGAGYFTLLQSYGSGESWFGAYLVDVDMDNDNDIIVSAFYSGEGGAKVWSNDGSGNFTLTQENIASGIATRQIAITDLNGDNTPDMFLPAYSGSGSQVWLNNGSGTFVNTNQVLSGGNCTQAAVADFDGDGDPDVYISKTNGSPNAVYLNDGSGDFSDTGQALGSAFSNGAQAADVDGDGDYDVVVSNWQVPSRVWLNDGNAFFSPGFAIQNDNYGKAIELADIDYDCDFDVIIGSYGSNGLQVWTNNGLGEFDLCFENSSDIYAHGIALGDMNNDLMPDIWVGNFSSSSGDHIFLKTSPVVIYDTVQLCPSDSIFLQCEWRTTPGDYLEGINCDTLGWYHVTTVSIDTNVTLSNTVLTAVPGYDSYQWIDCTAMTPVAGANSNVFDPELTSWYMVEITYMGCADTSNCHFVQTPIAEFTGTPIYGPVPHTVNFTDLSVDSVNTWQWDFGDGGTSTEQNPTHEYLITGYFPVSLTVSGPGGSDSITKLSYVYVFHPAPTCDFIGDPLSGLAPLEVQFTDLSVDSVNTWEWDFGDGSTSGLQNPQYTYTSPGIYTVELTVSGPGGDDAMQKTDYINVGYDPPVADFEGNPTMGSAPLQVQFTDLSIGAIDAWHWYFGDGDTANVQDPVHTYVSSGLFAVSLAVSGPGGNDSITKEDYIMIPVGMEDNSAEAVMVYPNPANEKVFIDFPDEGERIISFQNMEGQSVLTRKSNARKETIELKTFPEGVYTVNIFHVNTGSITTMKVVKGRKP